MGVALIVVWAILGLLWLVTAPGVLVAFAAVGDPPRGFLPGWVLAFLGWLSVPVTVVLALVAIAGDGAVGVRPWLPVASLLVVPAGYLVGLVTVRVVARLGGGPPPPPTPPRRLRPGDLDALDDDALAAHQLDVVGAAVARWFPDGTSGLDPAFPRLVLDSIRRGDDGEAVRRALDEHRDLERGRRTLTPPPPARQHALWALLMLARLRGVRGPDRPPRRDEPMHQELLDHAHDALEND
ncbi:hypothetical protein [Actinomycetospora callitridis]|uniref:hypothetical protein n=1 Tax=Actinomycetospora callitridis TaxID=913944 RepID=UPI002366B257|nr:hypothetical protein [Actinomycetospora callitridis]MDD7917278.1 hypothetical protein [Actinomycetospora callitridis]